MVLQEAPETPTDEIKDIGLADNWIWNDTLTAVDNLLFPPQKIDYIIKK